MQELSIESPPQTEIGSVRERLVKGREGLVRGREGLLIRPLRCLCGVCCCCVQELSIESPTQTEIGSVRERLVVVVGGGGGNMPAGVPVVHVVLELLCWQREGKFSCHYQLVVSYTLNLPQQDG